MCFVYSNHVKIDRIITSDKKVRWRFHFSADPDHVFFYCDDLFMYADSDLEVIHDDPQGTVKSSL